MRTNSGVCQRRVWQLSTVESEARNSYALFERISGKGEMNSMVSINCPSIIDPINEKYSYSGVPVLVVKGILNKSRASNSHNYLIPINLSWWYLFSVRVRYSYYIKKLWVLLKKWLYYMYFQVIFSTYYNPSHLLWEVVDNSMSSFWRVCYRQKGCIIGTVRGLIPQLTHPQWYNLLLAVNLMQVPRGSPDIYTRAEVLI